MLEPIRARYEAHLIARDLSPKTISTYVNTLLQAERWCLEHGHDLSHLDAHTTRLMGESVWPFTHGRRRQARLAIRHYWDLDGRRDGPYKAIRMPKKPRGRNRALRRDDARALAKAATDWHPQGTAVLVGLYMALRASEIASIRWDRFDPDLSWYTVLGKGDVTASIPVHTTLRVELARWRTANMYLFPGARGRAYVTATTVGNWTSEVAETGGIQRITPHVLRHTAITELNDATGDLGAAQAFARHARPETTALYTRVDGQRLTAAVESIDYLSCA